MCTYENIFTSFWVRYYIILLNLNNQKYRTNKITAMLSKQICLRIKFKSLTKNLTKLYLLNSVSLVQFFCGNSGNKFTTSVSLQQIQNFNQSLVVFAKRRVGMKNAVKEKLNIYNNRHKKHESYGQC